MAPREFVKLVGQLSRRLVDAPDTFSPTQRNEEWTKINFILPLLEALGWDRFKDVNYEDSPQDIEGWLDFILRCRPSIGIEAKALGEKPPEDRTHRQIEKGLKQSKDRGAAYFIWTNGDSWEFFSLALPDAPIYNLALSNVHGDPQQIEHIASEFNVIEKGSFTANPKLFDEAIRKNWKRGALPAALEMLVKERKHDLLQLIRQDLPSEIGIEDEEILAFFRELKWSGAGVIVSRPGKIKDKERHHSFPEDWQKLLHSYEPEYERANKRFREGYYRKLAQYLIDDQCRPWSSSTTWRYVGMPKDADERKKLGGVIKLFRDWHFIEDAEGFQMYQRVGDGVPFLKKLLEKE